jgi:hypothetical protein
MQSNSLIWAANGRIADTGILLALFLALGYLFLYIPNVEFITLIAWLGGLLLGAGRGLFVALVGEAIFSVMNPLGSSLVFLPLFVAQITGFALIALSGAAARFWISKLLHHKLLLTVFAALNGLLVTLIYDLLTTLAFPLASGFSKEQTIATLLAGIPFVSIHLVVNTATFALILPSLLLQIARFFPRFGLQK